MKIVNQTTTVTLGLYHLLTPGQVYSSDHQRGTRLETRYFMRCDKGMVCLDNGMYIPPEAFTDSNGAYAGVGFRPHPTASVSV